MRSFRAKPVGWRGDSYRHYLAQKGVGTRRYAASMKSKIADKINSTYDKKSVNREFRILQEWLSGGKEDHIKERLGEGMSHPQAVIDADRVEEGIRRQVNVDIKRRSRVKENVGADELDLDVAMYKIRGERE